MLSRVGPLAVPAAWLVMRPVALVLAEGPPPSLGVSLGVSLALPVPVAVPLPLPRRGSSA